ncbi:methyltransferase domain-containing protein [Nocardia sp. NPDC005366]|uniref:class I SAM-dependent methyltransferase n=1 Tax=Nocardia sp. NPDC005366 TaxID=3156878 RepID=UPI0033B79168
MSSRLDAEYADPTPLRVRIDTHEHYSEKAHDPTEDVLAALGLSGAEYLADIGCGDARFLADLVSSGHRGRLVGIDTSPTMVAAADVLPGVLGVLADAERIPFDDNTFDTITARHMLYHVDNPRVALDEFRRTTKPGGTVAVVVNHPGNCPRTAELVAAHANTYGIEQTGSFRASVDSDSLPRLMSDVFGAVRIHRSDNALVFDSAEPLVRFAEALFAFYGVPADLPERDAILEDLRADVEDWFAAHPGERWRDPKGYVVAAARVDAG